MAGVVVKEQSAKTPACQNRPGDRQCRQIRYMRRGNKVFHVRRGKNVEIVVASIIEVAALCNGLHSRK